MNRSFWIWTSSVFASLKNHTRGMGGLFPKVTLTSGGGVGPKFSRTGSNGECSSIREKWRRYFRQSNPMCAVVNLDNGSNCSDRATSTKGGLSKLGRPAGRLVLTELRCRETLSVRFSSG